MNKQKIIKILDKIIEIAFYVLIAATTFSTTFVELSITVIIFSWAIAKIVKKDFSAPKHLFLAMFVIFVLWNIISFANTKYMHESIRGLIKIIKYGLILTIAMDVFKSVFTLKKAIYFLIIWSVIVSLNGIAQSRLGFDLIRLKTIDTLDYLSRISSSFHHPNDFGVYLVLVIPIFLSFIFSKKTGMQARIYFLLGLLPLAFCILRTYSRGAWVTLLIAVAILGLLKSKRLFVALCILTVILFLFLPQQARQRVFDLSNFKEGTTWERLKLWGGALAMIKEHPFIGFGVNTYTKNFIEYKPPDYWNAVYSHNCYLQMASEIGLVGVGIFFIFIFLIFLYIYRSLNITPVHSGWSRNATIGLFSGLIGFLAYSMVDTHLYSTNLAVMFYLFLGLCIAICNYARVNPA